MAELQRYLTERGMSASALARKAQVSKSLVCNAAQGLPIGSVLVAQRVARATDNAVSVDDLTRPVRTEDTPLGRWLAQTGTEVSALAERSGVSADTIRKVCRGLRLIRAEPARALSDATDGAVTLDDLCAGAE